jgi:broad specificity phosphatase PhoE
MSHSETRPRAAAALGRLIFIRHGETDWNRDGRLQGQRNIALNAKGRDQALGAGQLLRPLLSEAPHSTFYASPLDRARETMLLVRQASGLEPLDAFALDDHLRELTFGGWEGLTWRQVRENDPIAAQRRRLDKWHFIPPQGESYAMLSERVEFWLESLNGNVVVVAHGGIARVLLVVLGRVSHRDAASAVIHQGRLLVFDGQSFEWV